MEQMSELLGGKGRIALRTLMTLMSVELERGMSEIEMPVPELRMSLRNLVSVLKEAK